jgi:hypothetical protein
MGSKIMKLTKAQQQSRMKAIQKATLAALQAHFTGDGAFARTIRFLRSVVMASAGWTAKFVFIGSWAVIAGLLVGPEHDFFLKQVYAWMVEMPVDKVLEQTHSMLLSASVYCIQLGVLVGFGQELLCLIKPAVKKAKQQFEIA